MMPYYVRIARFMPRVEIIQKHNTTVRRLYIQGDNGKVQKRGEGEGGREERETVVCRNQLVIHVLTAC